MSTTNPTDIISEWDELQIKYGNYPECPKTVTNEEVSEQVIELAEQVDPLESKSLHQLSRLEDDLDESLIRKYRQRRLAELKKHQSICKFNHVYHINRAEYCDEITNASQCKQIVILHLYTESKSVCHLINRALQQLAPKHQYIKFCKAIGSDIVPNIPDSHLPTVLIYYNKTCLHQFIGDLIWGGENQCTLETVEYILWAAGLLHFCRTHTDPRPSNHLPVPRLLKTETIEYQHSASSSSENDDDEDNYSKSTKNYASTTLDRLLKS